MDVSFETQDLIRDMLEVHYKKRLTAAQVRASLDNMLAAKKKNVSSNQTVPTVQADPNVDKSKSKSVSFFYFYLG